MREATARSGRKHRGRSRKRSAARGRKAGDSGPDPAAERIGDNASHGRTKAEDGTPAADRGPSGSVGQAASEIVHRAAAILEEEIAAGIVAAKQVEARFVGPDEISDGSPQELFQRFRKDAHEVADTIIDFLSTLTSNLGLLTDRLAEPNGSGSGESGEAVSTNGSIRVKATAGETTRTTVSVGDSDRTVTLVFRSTDLVAQSGERLPASCVTFEPERVRLTPGEEADVAVLLSVPPRVVAGVYLGLIRWGRDGRYRSVLEARVG